MAIQLGFDIVKETFTQTTIFGIDWFITALVTIIAIALIAGKNWNDYKTLLLPVTIGLHVIGLTPSLIQYVIGALLLVMETMSLEMLGNIAETITKGYTRTTESIGMIGSKIYDRGQYRAVKEKYTEMGKEGLTSRLGRIFKKQTTIGWDSEGKPIKKEVIDEDALEQARKAGLGIQVGQFKRIHTGIGGLGKTLRKDADISQTRKATMIQDIAGTLPAMEIIKQQRRQELTEINQQMLDNKILPKKYKEEIQKINQKYKNLLSRVR